MAIYKTKLYALKPMYDMNHSDIFWSLTSGNKSKRFFYGFKIVMAMSVFFWKKYEGIPLRFEQKETKPG